MLYSANESAQLACGIMRRGRADVLAAKSLLNAVHWLLSFH